MVSLLDDSVEEPATSTTCSGISNAKAHASIRSAAVLRSIPFAIPFEKRVNVFQALILRDKQPGRVADHRFSFGFFDQPSKQVTIRRDRVAKDGFDKLGQANLKQRLRIQFIDKFGNEE